MKHIIWDWNGTLLNDLDFCISTINTLLQKRNLPTLNRNTYKEVFSFPVKDYYAAIGFDFEKEDFSVPAREFIKLYNMGVKNCKLQDQATRVLKHFRNKGKKQFVLSAMKQNMLEKTLQQNNILHFFEAVVGLNDHYAVSKIERGKQLMAENKIPGNDVVIIGDTTHDYEVAEKLGISCILISDGHQSAERLQRTACKIINKLDELYEITD